MYWLQQGNERNKQNSAMAEWCAVFDLNSDQKTDRGECTRRGAQLIRLARDVRREAEQLPEHFHPDLLLEHFPEVEDALDVFTALPNMRLEDMYARIHGTGWQSLKLLDALLSANRPEIVVEHDAINDLREQVRALIDDILGDQELDASLKRYMIARLRDIEDALTDALITGIDGVALAAHATYGAARLDRDWWDRIERTKWAPRIAGIWMTLMTTLGGVGAVLALMPGDEPQPAITQETNTTIVIESPEDGDDVVDAEVVEETPPSDPSTEP
jgi:hypothetical protein